MASLAINDYSLALTGRQLLLTASQKSKSKLRNDWRFAVSPSWRQAPRGPPPEILLQLSPAAIVLM
jgi:hypothetical protein